VRQTRRFSLSFFQNDSDLMKRKHTIRGQPPLFAFYFRSPGSKFSEKAKSVGKFAITLNMRSRNFSHSLHSSRLLLLPSRSPEPDLLTHHHPFCPSLFYWASSSALGIRHDLGCVLDFIQAGIQ
jgi:hypothetical protein